MGNTMSATQAYPTPVEIIDRIDAEHGGEYAVSDDEFDGDKVDDLVYEAISCWDEKFDGDPEWFDEEGDDEKDRIRWEVLELLHLRWYLPRQADNILRCLPEMLEEARSETARDTESSGSGTE
jgi:hypothetical protein